MGHMFLAGTGKYRGGRGQECKVVGRWGGESGEVLAKGYEVYVVQNKCYADLLFTILSFY